jgi:type IX secretion system PorP/SprF family membrane protein
MKKYYILLIVLFGALSAAQAQDPQFSQFYAAPLYLNPGFTGITYSQRVTFNSRVQWPNLPQAYSTSMVSYDIFVPELKSGFGVMAMRDKIGTGGLSLINAGLLYSYKIRASDDWVFSPGIYFGYGQMTIDKDKLKFGDGLGNNSNGSDDPVIDGLSNEQYFDFGSGLVVYNKNLWLGIAAYHMNEPNQSLSQNTDQLDMKYNIHGGMRLALNSGIRTSTRVTYLTPSFVYRKQGTFEQLDVGMHYHIDPIMIGVWYRGIPFLKDFADRPIQDALVFIFGLQFKNFNFGYSYDFTISDLETSAAGSHEISMGYEFIGKPIRGRVKKSRRLLECPSFYKRKDFWN